MRTWIKPSAIKENFASNQSVSACYSLYCKVAGDGKGNWTGNNYFHRGPNSGFNQKFSWAKVTVEPDHMEHGKPCACGSSYDEGTDKFYEFNKPAVSFTDPNVSNVIDSSVPNGYQATWNSTDTNGDVYHHYGYAINDQPDKPNHS